VPIKVFLDANILLDFTLKRKEYASAKALIKLGIDSLIQLHITPSVLHITAYWVSKSYGLDKAKELLPALLNDIRLIDCDHATALMAINSKMTDIEDALQYYTALKYNMSYFISSDKKLKKEAMPQLPVYTAAYFVKEFKSGL